jgi:hypothetical protein
MRQPPGRHGGDRSAAAVRVIRQDGTIVGEHRRRFGRGATIYDPFCNRNAAVKPPHFVGSVSCLNIGFRPFSVIRLDNEIEVRATPF